MANLRLFSCLSTLLLVCLGASVAHAQLPDPVAQALRQAKIPESSVTFWVAPAQGGAPVVEHNATRAYNPASVMKMLTTFSALDSLGPTYAWTTNAYMQGSLYSNGVLNGNLILRGGGDPAMTWDRFGQLLREVRSRGIETIQGDLIIDRSLYRAMMQNKDDFDDEPQRAYNAAPDAMLVNFKAITFRLTPLSSGQINVTSMTPFAPMQIDNRLKAAAGACPNWRTNIGAKLEPDGAGLRLTVSGSMPSSCGEKMLNLTAQDGVRMTSGIFRAQWEELGGKWTGTVREGTVPASATLVGSWSSPPLSDVIRDVNRFSNNVMARQIFLTMGNPEASSAIASNTNQSDQAIRAWLRARRLEMPNLVLENGSGLSRAERLTSEGLGRLLQFAWQSPRMPQFVSSLPIAGGDGTAKRRFEGQVVAGNGYLKTGSLSGVMAIAGYIQDTQKRWQTVVMIVNDPRAAGAEPAMIQAANWVYNH